MCIFDDSPSRESAGEDPEGYTGRGWDEEFLSEPSALCMQSTHIGIYVDKHI